MTLRQDAAAARRTAHFSTEDPVERSVFLGLADDLDADAATAFAKRSKLGRSAMMWDHAGWALMAAGGFLMADALMGMGVLSTASGR